VVCWSVDVDSLLHPLARVKPDVHVILHACPHGKYCFENEEADEEGNVGFLVEEAVQRLTSERGLLILTDVIRRFSIKILREQSG
jgi:hypothetical protein